jgi:anti-sigma B factor antagonist
MAIGLPSARSAGPLPPAFRARRWVGLAARRERAMSSHELLRLSQNQGVTVVRFVDNRILDEANIQQLGEELFSLVEEEDHPRLLLNFADVEFLSSAALGKLISLKKKAAVGAREVKLCCIRPEIYEVFKITNLDQVFDIQEDEQDALDAFAAS